MAYVNTGLGDLGFMPSCSSSGSAETDKAPPLSTNTLGVTTRTSVINALAALRLTPESFSFQVSH